MRETISTQNFSNVGELESILEGMDDYEVLPGVVYHEKYPEGITGKIGIMTNVTKGRHCMATSMEYPVFDHKLAFGFAAAGIRKRGAGIHGKVETWGDKSYLTGLFDEIKLIEGKTPDGDDSIIEMGFHLENAMDRKIAFKGDGYTMRLACANGAKAKHVLPQFVLHEWHTIDMEVRVPAMIETFTNGLLSKAGYLQEVINIASASKIVFETQESLDATMMETYKGISPRHIQKILDQIETLTPSRWDMFNASSWVTSHNEKMSPDIRNSIGDISSKFLNMTQVIIPVIPEAKPVAVQGH
jgi:hypothetical protein